MPRSKKLSRTRKRPVAYTPRSKAAPEPPRNKEWFDRILKSRGRSMRSVSEEIFDGLSTKDYLRGVINRDRGISPSEFSRLAQALRVPITELLSEGFNIPVEGVRCEVVGTLADNGEVVKLPPNLSVTTKSPFPDSFDILALRVDAKDGALKPWHGAHLFFKRSELLEVRAANRLAYIELEDGSAVVGYVDSVREPATLLLFGGAPARLNVTLKTATPILWIRLA